MRKLSLILTFGYSSHENIPDFFLLKSDKCTMARILSAANSK